MKAVAEASALVVASVSCWRAVFQGLLWRVDGLTRRGYFLNGLLLALHGRIHLALQRTQRLFELRRGLGGGRLPGR